MTQHRRDFLLATAGTTAAMAWPQWGQAAPPGKRLRLAAIITEYTYRSHAHVILENFFEPFYFNGKLIDPGMDVVAMYVDQTPAGADLSPQVSQKYNVPIFSTIAEALQVGGQELAVDGVLSIGEHGSYPLTERGQIMYPRKRFFDEIVAVFRRSGKVVPLFNDKHLSYRWDWSVEMMETAKELGIPFMAGSSVPLAERVPPLELPQDAQIEEALVIHGGSLDAYDFHGLEVLQSMVESRRGGETGVAEIQLLENDEVWQAAKAGRWNRSLADAAMQTEFPGRKVDLPTFADPVVVDPNEPDDNEPQSIHALLITYRDGLKATVLRVGKSATRWNFACRLKGEATPRATRFNTGPWNNRNLFKALAHAIQNHMRQGRAPYPVERTHLVTGMLAAAMDSRFEQHKRLETPHLAISYAPRDFRAMREMGATWKIITNDVPQPKGLESGNPRPES